jgi:hypothetical protein
MERTYTKEAAGNIKKQDTTNILKNSFRWQVCNLFTRQVLTTGYNYEALYWKNIGIYTSGDIASTLSVQAIFVFL